MLHSRANFTCYGLHTGAICGQGEPTPSLCGKTNLDALQEFVCLCTRF
jgi:hypothetical protein